MEGIDKKELLNLFWRARLALVEASARMRLNGEQLKDAGFKLLAAGNMFLPVEIELKKTDPRQAARLYEKGKALRTEGDLLRRQKSRVLKASGAIREAGIKIWDEVVFKICGPVKIEWFDGGCRLETGEEFKEE